MKFSPKVTSYFYVLLSFLTAPLGGFFVGFVAGLVASLVAKYTSERDEYLKPILNLLFACLAYMITLLFGFSNILGLIAVVITATPPPAVQCIIGCHLLAAAFVSIVTAALWRWRFPCLRQLCLMRYR